MFTTSRLCVALGSAVLTFSTSGALAAAFPWLPTPNVGGTGFNYSNGQTTNGLFGPHTLSGNTFNFTPTGFIADASSPLQGRTTTDRLSVKLDANSPTPVQMVTITESGTWKIRGTGQVKAFGSMFLTRLDTIGFATRWNDTLKVVYKEDIDDTLGINLVTLSSNPKGTVLDTSKEGIWTASVQINIAAFNVNSVQVVMDNILQAASSGGNTDLAQISKTGFGLDAVVPEPTGIALALVGGASLLLRRRKPASA